MSFKLRLIIYHNIQQTATIYGIIQTTEICALEQGNDGYFEKSENLWQVSNKILSKDVKKKHQNNLTIGERKTVREINNNKT